MPTLPPVAQPSFTFDHGAMVTIGIVVNNDRCAIVLPMAHVGAPDPTDILLAGLCGTIETVIFPLLVPMLTSAAYISFVQAEGMYPGDVPYRIDYLSSDHPGTGDTDAMPSQVGGMIYWYESESGHFGRNRIRLAKNFIPGVPRTNVFGDNLNGAYRTLGDELASTLQHAIVDTLNSEVTWYRVLAKPTENPDHSKPPLPECPLKNILQYGTRRYLVTQRRRLIPR